MLHRHGMAMMSRLFSTLPNTHFLVAAMAVNICLLNSEPAEAEGQTLDSVDSARFAGRSAPVSSRENGVDDSFAARSGTVEEFALDADGKIRPAALGRQDAANEGLLSLPEWTSHGGMHSQIDISEEATEQDCGPSPLSAPEVARLVVAAAEKYGVDPDFALAVATAESRLDWHRNSPKGAYGPMQLMPATAERFGVDDICDPASNIDGGIRFLRGLFDTLENPLLVAAAYNAGEARVREYGGIPPFRETLGFVAEVINRRLGLPDRATQERLSTINSASTAANSDPPTGVITTTERRRWVGGVMHF
jgi:Transglycosylase SLT domain